MNKKSDRNTFVERANKIYNNKYNYDNSIYISIRDSIEIVCPIHGAFIVTALAHLRTKSACKKCWKFDYYQNNFNTFKDKCNLIHKFKYKYVKETYLGHHQKMTIICPNHGEFLQNPHDHIVGKGCTECVKIGLPDFIKRAAIIHDNYYNYSDVIYVNNYTKITIKCPTHNEFTQLPKDHLRGQGCPKCARSFSKIETVWLEYLNIPNEFWQKRSNLINALIK